MTSSLTATSSSWYIPCEPGNNLRNPEEFLLCPMYRNSVLGRKTVSIATKPPDMDLLTRELLQVLSVEIRELLGKNSGKNRVTTILRRNVRPLNVIRHNTSPVRKDRVAG